MYNNVTVKISNNITLFQYYISFFSNNINPKPCNYGCITRMYWNTSENAYFKVFSGNRHQCPNRQQNNYNKKPHLYYKQVAIN